MKGAAIIALIKSFPELVEAIGDGDDSVRVYPKIAPQDEPTPYVTYRKILNTPTNSFTKESNFEFARYDLHVYAPTQDEAEEVADLLREKLSGHHNGTFAGVDINYVEYVDDSDDFNTNTELYEHQIEFNFNHRRQP